MSARLFTVAELQKVLLQYDPEMYVALKVDWQPGNEYEGFLNGPTGFNVIPVKEVRSGFNPIAAYYDNTQADFKVLVIS